MVLVQVREPTPVGEKTWNRNYIDNASASYGASINFTANVDYSYEPWNGSNDPTMGYVTFDSNPATSLCKFYPNLSEN